MSKLRACGSGFSAAPVQVAAASGRRAKREKKKREREIKTVPYCVLKILRNPDFVQTVRRATTTVAYTIHVVANSVAGCIYVVRRRYVFL